MDWIDDYVEFASKVSEPAVIFHEWCAVSAVASCLQRKCKLNIGLLTFYPNMYIVLVGPSGCRKGTAMRMVGNMLHEIKGVIMSSESTTREALIRNVKRATNTEVEGGRVTKDSSITIYSEEFTVFLGYNNFQLITDITDWYDGGRGKEGRWTYETVGRGKEEIIGMWVNLLGATTPEAIQTSLPIEAIGIGLASRIIFVYASKRYKTLPFPILTSEDSLVRDLLQKRLEEMLLMKGEFSVTEEFVERYSEWYLSHDRENPFNDPRFSGYIGRRASHILKLCMIFCASRSNNMIMDTIDLERAIDLLARTEKNMTKVFSGFGRRPGIDVMNSLMVDLSNYKEMSFETIMRKYYKEVNNEEMLSIIASLESMKYAIKVIDDKGVIRVRYLKED